MKFVDLHVHSLVSDGSFCPEELAKQASAAGLSAFTLTDHDNIAGNEAAAAAAKAAGLEFINGMELSAEYNGRKIHIVCLGFDPEHPSFQLIYQRIRSIKEGRIPEMIDFVAHKGVDISLEKVKEFAQGRPIDRYAIMRYLVSLQLYDRAQPLWDNYLDPAAVALGLDVNITAEEALPRIREAGGVTSLAHFHKDIGLKGLTRKEQETAILHLHSMGLNGMERFYPNYSADDAAFAGYMIEKYDLMPTGGTDFHGANRPNVAMGTGIGGNMAVPYEFFTGVQKRCGII
ncbi:PHP domain-containing protein [Selenomonas sp. ND2010]|jgi:predicted metal-dependent phosphoesterase TrpH|uniref:PHP domain-containing protein n=1 Tax=Selenomonas sp. ND2010 TaxID=1410618 RepID=UPI00051C5BB6|nr:PHP domain-containing protein [Selenomonas sp. ND2010]